MQAAVNLAASGDTVLLPNACSVTWSGSVTIPNTKGITLDGNKASVARGGLSSGTPADCSALRTASLPVTPPKV